MAVHAKHLLYTPVQKLHFALRYPAHSGYSNRQIKTTNIHVNLMDLSTYTGLDT